MHFGYNHVTVRPSVMNSSARIEPNDFDLNAVKLAFLRPPATARRTAIPIR